MGFTDGARPGRERRSSRLRRVVRWPRSVWRSAMLRLGIARIRAAARKEQRRTVKALRDASRAAGAAASSPASPPSAPSAPSAPSTSSWPSGAKGKAPCPTPYVMAPPPRARPWEAHVTDTRCTREVRRLVGALGRSPGEIALSLEALRVRSDGHRSPLDVYLTAVVGADARVRSVRVFDDRVEIVLGKRWRSTVVVGLPPAAGAFAAAFRAGCYPALSVRQETIRPAAE